MARMVIARVAANAMAPGDTGVMKMKRTWYPTKSAWARAQADRLRAQERAALADRLPSSDWRGVKAKMTRIDTLRREAHYFERLAERFSDAGL